MNQLLTELGDVLETFQRPENVAPLDVPANVQVIYTFKLFPCLDKYQGHDLIFGDWNHQIHSK